MALHINNIIPFRFSWIHAKKISQLTNDEIYNKHSEYFLSNLKHLGIRPLNEANFTNIVNYPHLIIYSYKDFITEDIILKMLENQIEIDTYEHLVDNPNLSLPFLNKICINYFQIVECIESISIKQITYEQIYNYAKLYPDLISMFVCDTKPRNKKEKAFKLKLKELNAPGIEFRNITTLGKEFLDVKSSCRFIYRLIKID